MTITKDEKNVQIYCEMRFCCVDSPARAFEMGQQIGGNYRCPGGVKSQEHYNLGISLLCKQRNILDVDELIRRGTLYTKKDGIIFKDLTKSELEIEVRERGLHPGTTYYTCNRDFLQNILNNELRGIQRFPAILQFRDEYSLASMNCLKYEVCNFELMHDFVNVFDHLMNELPSHYSSLNLKAFFDVAKGDKPKLRAVDARRLAIKLFVFLDSMDYCPVELKRLVQYVVEISEIGYSLSEKRCPRQILRFHNLTFCFAMLLQDIVGNSPQKVSSLYGIHFHNLTAHAPVAQRLIAMRSLLAERDESLIYRLKKISESTSSRRPNEIIENAVLRLAVLENIECTTEIPEDSVVSKEAAGVRHAGNCVLQEKWLVGRTGCVEAHFTKISDYLKCGQWSEWRGNELVFRDAAHEDDFRDVVNLFSKCSEVVFTIVV